jgi:hypothetical protein
MADLEENARRKAAGKKEIALSPIAIEIVRRIDALFAIERTINGEARSMAKAPTTERLSARRRALRWLPIWKAICVSSAQGSPAVTIWQRP